MSKDVGCPVQFAERTSSPDKGLICPRSPHRAAPPPETLIHPWHRSVIQCRKPIPGTVFTLGSTKLTFLWPSFRGQGQVRKEPLSPQAALLHSRDPTES